MLDNKNIIFTKHALERLELRKITKDMVVRTVEFPDNTFFEDDGDTKFVCRVNGRSVHVIGKPLPKEKWLIKSVWVRGEEDPWTMGFKKRFSNLANEDPWTIDFKKLFLNLAIALLIGVAILIAILILFLLMIRYGLIA